MTEGDRGVWFIYQDPMFDTVRAEPRFQSLLRQLSLPTSR